ncbi:hypothetical protein OIM19_18770, partial [Salmonella enterica subsp. enterica serovar Senftenberg]|nr:hypothetical protein [Salmonella enterica subsp. enterica serovar Senftenberg]MCV9866911.1 hypothetical protein [Salmonella enterica subsp. enterica serovar Senftenberg]
MKRLICGWFQIKRLEPSYCLSTIRHDWQSFNTRTIERSPVGRNHAPAYGVVAASIHISTSQFSLARNSIPEAGNLPIQVIFIF